MSNVENPLKVIDSRVVIPTWKAPDQAIESSAPNQKTLQNRKALAQKWLQQLKFGYKEAPSPHKAVELYENALIYGLENELPPEVLEIGLKSFKNLKIQGPGFWEVSEQSFTQSQAVENSAIDFDHQIKISVAGVRKYKKLLSDNPNRPFCWSELARNYLFLKQNDKAIECMRIALKLSSNNLYLSRAATRLFIQIDNHNEALKVLHSIPGFSNEPWLLSAEIAASSAASKTSKHVKTAQKLLISHDFSSYQLSELAAAVGTIEMDNGATKKAKQMFNASLRTPTANSLAQAQWAVEKDSSIIIPTNAWQETPEPFEASALAARLNRDWAKVMQECVKWLTDEPYSIGPTYIASYISFFPELHKVAEQFATYGLKLEPENSILLNNRAVARAYLGNLEGALIDIKAALNTEEGRQSAQLHATLGLVAFRSGYALEGKEFYGTSIAWFSKKRDKDSLSSAILHYLREETRTDKSAIQQSIDITKQLQSLTLSAKAPELSSFCEVLLAEIEDDKKLSANDQSQIKPPASAEDLRDLAARFEFPKKEETNLNQIIRNVRDLTKLL